MGMDCISFAIIGINRIDLGKSHMDIPDGQLIASGVSVSDLYSAKMLLLKTGDTKQRI